MFEAGWLKMVKKALENVVKETEAWAQQHETDGRYKDAAYLHGRIHSDLKSDSKIVPTLSAVYERLGDLPAAELAQEKLTDIIFDEGWATPDEEKIHEVDRLSRLYKLFHDRLQVLGADSQSYAKLSVVYRAAALDLMPLNVALFEQGLIFLDCFKQWSLYCLHIAAIRNAPNLVRLLIRSGANLNVKNDVGDTPLHIAVRSRAGKIVQSLLDGGANTGIRDRDGNTAVHIALLGHQDERMLSYLIPANADIEARDYLGRTPLCHAIASSSPSIVRYLIQCEADVNASCDVSNSLGTLLFETVRQRKTWATEILLGGGADWQARDSTGRRAIYYAVRGGQESMVKMLLDHGSTETPTSGPASNSGSTLLHCAMIKPEVAIVEMLLKAQVDVNGQDLVGDTALHMLMRYRPPSFERTINVLINHGAQVNTLNNEADTPLHFAVHSGRQDIAQILLDAGANCGIVNMSGMSPLDVVERQSVYSSDALERESWGNLKRRMWRIRDQISVHEQDIIH